MELVRSDDVLPEARRTRDDVAEELRALGIPGDLVLTGASSVPGALTKGDVDLHLRVEGAAFEEVVERLRGVYPVGSPHAWAATLAVFDVSTSRPAGLAVTPVGSVHDVRFTEAWQALRDHPEWLQAYNSLKAEAADPDAYEVRKAAFFDDPPWAPGRPRDAGMDAHRVPREDADRGRGGNEMWSHTYTHRTTADPERLWQLLADVDGWVNWNDGIEQIRLQGPLAVGTVFVMKPPGEKSITSTIVELDPPRRISDNTELEGISVKVEHRLDPEPGGATTIVYAISVTGDVPEEVAAEVGTAVSADFPDVMAALADTAGRD